MADFPVSPEKRKALEEKMARFGVREDDLVERFVRSSGPGGQNVNKVSTCVHLRHGPTGVEVKCGSERSQALNRYLARRLLVGKIEAAVLGRKSEERRKIEKVRRQKRRRSRRAKERMLADKRMHSRKKDLRGRVPHDD